MKILALLLLASFAQALPPAPDDMARRAEASRDWDDYRRAAAKDVAQAAARLEAVEASARGSGGEALRRAEERVLDLRLRQAEASDLLERFDRSTPAGRDALRVRLDSALTALRSELRRTSASPAEGSADRP